jgi:hypothetical protein
MSSINSFPGQRYARSLGVANPLLPVGIKQKVSSHLIRAQRDVVSVSDKVANGMRDN